MSTGKKLETVESALEFILGGKAIFTLRSQRTGEHVTLRARQSERGDMFFIGLMTGDNEFGYSYLGQVAIGAGEKLWYSHGRKSTVSADCKQAKAAQWALGHLLNGRMPQGLEVWHEGQCRACGRKLTMPESIQAGIGPECGARSASKAHPGVLEEMGLV